MCDKIALAFAPAGANRHIAVSDHLSLASMRRRIRKVLTGLLALFLFPLAIHAVLYTAQDHAESFGNANWSSTGMRPPAASDKEARVLIFAGRTGRWRGIFSVHSWVVIKPE